MAIPEGNSLLDRCYVKLESQDLGKKKKKLDKNNTIIFAVELRVSSMRAIFVPPHWEQIMKTCGHLCHGIDPQPKRSLRLPQSPYLCPQVSRGAVHDGRLLNTGRLPLVAEDKQEDFSDRYMGDINSQ